MPGKATTKKVARKRSVPPRAQKKIKTVMHEFKEGELHSGGSGKTVKNPKQAIAIALSEAREAGASIPKKKSSPKKKASK